MLALKVYRRAERTHVYVLESSVCRRRLVYGGAPKARAVNAAIAAVPGAEQFAVKLHGAMVHEPVWRVPVDQHDALVEALRAVAPIVEIVPPQVLAALRVPARRAPGDVAARVGDVLWRTLMPFQRDGVEYTVANRGRALVFFEMGLGKTLTAIGVLAYYAAERPAIVVCPAVVKASWRTHIAEHLGLRAHDIKTWTDEFSDADINLLSFGMFNSPKFAAKIAAFQPRVMVVDESHYCKNGTSARTKAVFRWSQRAQRVVLLTGTPSNRPCDLYSQIKCVDATLFRSFFHYRPYLPATGVVTSQSPPDRIAQFHYAARYCRPAQKMARGALQYVFRGSENEAELHAVLKQTCMIRRTTAQVLPQLPTLTRERVAIDEWVQPAALEFKSDAELMELVRDTAQRKLPFVQAYLKEIVVPELQNNPRLKVLLWGHHSFFLDGIEETMRAECAADTCALVRMDGGTSLARRAEYVDRFQKDPNTRVAVLSITACGTGITMTKATLSVFAELLFTATDMMQSEKRCHRLGQDLPVISRFLICEGSTDSLIWQILTQKTRTTAMTLDGREQYLNARAMHTADLRAAMDAADAADEVPASDDEDEEPAPNAAKRRRPERAEDNIDWADC